MSERDHEGPASAQIVDLSTYGFERVGSWVLNGDYTNYLSHLPGIKYEVDASSRRLRHVVYAFTFDEELVYVGETAALDGLCSRFDGYRSGQKYAADTDNHVKEGITCALQGHRDVGIWAVCPIAHLELPDGTVGGLHGHKVLEAYMIERHTPPLNKHNSERRRETGSA